MHVLNIRWDNDFRSATKHHLKLYSFPKKRKKKARAEFLNLVSCDPCLYYNRVGLLAYFASLQCMYLVDLQKQQCIIIHFSILKQIHFSSGSDPSLLDFGLSGASRW